METAGKHLADAEQDGVDVVRGYDHCRGYDDEQAPPNLAGGNGRVKGQDLPLITI